MIVEARFLNALDFAACATPIQQQQHVSVKALIVDASFLDAFDLAACATPVGKQQHGSVSQIADSDHDSTHNNTDELLQPMTVMMVLLAGLTYRP